MNDTSIISKIDKLVSLMIHAEVRLEAGLHHSPDDVFLGTVYWIVKDAQKIIKELYYTSQKKRKSQFRRKSDEKT